MNTQAWQWLGYMGSVGLRATGVLAVAALVALALARRSASARHLAWAAGLGAAALVTLLPAFLPRWELATLPSAIDARFTLGSGGNVVAGGAAAVGPVTPAAPGFGWATALFGLWLAGALFLLARLLVGLLGARRLVHAAIPASDPRLLALGADVARRGGLAAIPPLRLSHGIYSPMTAGLFRPAVLLPTEALSWGDERLRAVLAHELGHVRRGDCLTQALARLLLAIHWWNPLVWVAERRLLVERERACDDHAVADGTKASAYAGHLLALRRALDEAGPLGSLCGASGAAVLGCSALPDRIERILDPRRGHGLLGRRAALGAVGAALLLALPAACLTGASASNDPAPLTLTLVAEDGALAQRLADHAGRDGEAARLGLRVNLEQWSASKGRPAGSTQFLEGSRPALEKYLASVSVPRAAHERIALEKTDRAGVFRTVVLDERSRLTVGVVEASVAPSRPEAPDMFDVQAALAPEDAARLHALTSGNLGRQLALELGRGEIWGAPVIRSPIGERLSVTARGTLAEAEALAILLRTGAPGR